MYVLRCEVFQSDKFQNKMSQTQNSNIFRCFLCNLKISAEKPCAIIDRHKCPRSRKCFRDVLQYLARYAQIELYLAKDSVLCTKCVKQIVEFDTNLMKVLKQQRALVEQIEKAMTGVDSELEEELNSWQDWDDNDISDELPSENEIEQTVQDVISIANNDKSMSPNVPIITCHLCHKRFRGQLRLQKHLVQAHKRYKCDLCDFSHRNEDHVMLHKNIHEGRKESQCPFCYKEFTTKISTIRHMEVHLNSKKYQCDKCGLCFSQTTVLYNHKLQHEAEEQPLRCDVCQQLFKTKRTYRRHMITHRSDRPRYGCEQCGKTFTEKYTLKVHKRCHMEEARTMEETTQQHVVAAQRENNINQFNCIICDQLFLNKEQLNRHMEGEHDVILKSLTVSNFTQFEVLNTEMEKSCHLCGVIFKTQANLDIHFEQMHDITNSKAVVS